MTRIVSWNVNGIRSIARKGFHDWLCRESPSIVCLQETKAHKGQLPPDLVAPPGYEGHFHSAERKGYSGVATFVPVANGEAAGPLKKRCKAGLPALLNPPAPGIGISRFDAEGRVLATEFERFILLNCYFPNGQRDHGRLDYKLEFCESFLHFANGLRAAGKKLVICGDFNTAHKEIDLARPKQNAETSGFLPIERAWIDRFTAHGYVDIFRERHPEPDHYTWWSYQFNARANNVGWRIDYFFVSDDLAGEVTSAGIHPEVAGSDHCPVSISFT